MTEKDANDVLDDDLMKELGLDPNEMQEVKIKQDKVDKQKPVAPPPPAPSKTAKASTQPPPAPKTTQAVIPDEDLKTYGQKMAQEIPVNLAAVIGKRTLSLKNVIEFQVGDVIDFKKEPQDLIDLVANGKLVAKAELVLVEGRVGARIIKLIR